MSVYKGEYFSHTPWGATMPDTSEIQQVTSRSKLGEELLQAVHESAAAYHAAADEERATARERYLRALNRFNVYVLEGISSRSL
jgi:hypothetical protein